MDLGESLSGNKNYNLIPGKSLGEVFFWPLKKCHVTGVLVTADLQARRQADFIQSELSRSSLDNYVLLNKIIEYFEYSMLILFSPK